MSVKNITKKRHQKPLKGLWERPKNPVMGSFKHTLNMNNKRYEYTITPVNKKEVFFECSAAGIAQRFLAEDIPALLIDLPELILLEKEWQKKQSEMIRFRVSPEDKKTIEKKAIKAGYSTVSAFLRALALGA